MAALCPVTDNAASLQRMAEPQSVNAKIGVSAWKKWFELC